VWESGLHAMRVQQTARRKAGRPVTMMTTGDELGKSDVFVKLAVMLCPLVEEAVRPGMVIKEFERGLFGELLSTGRHMIDQFLVAQGAGDPGKTIAHPADRNNHQTTEPRKIHRSSELAARMLRTVFGEHEFFAYVYREGEDRRSPIVPRPVPQHKHLMAKLPGQNQALGDEIVRGFIRALSGSPLNSRRLKQRRPKPVSFRFCSL